MNVIRYTFLIVGCVLIFFGIISGTDIILAVGMATTILWLLLNEVGDYERRTKR